MATKEQKLELFNNLVVPHDPLGIGEFLTDSLIRETLIIEGEKIVYDFCMPLFQAPMKEWFNRDHFIESFKQSGIKVEYDELDNEVYIEKRLKAQTPNNDYVLYLNRGPLLIFRKNHFNGPMPRIRINKMRSRTDAVQIDVDICNYPESYITSVGSEGIKLEKGSGSNLSNTQPANRIILDSDNIVYQLAKIIL